MANTFPQQYTSAIKFIRRQKARIESGKLNSLPIGLPVFSRSSKIRLPRKTYGIVTAEPKAGKTQLADHIGLHSPIEAVYVDPALADYKDKVNVLYISLEEDATTKSLQGISRRLYTTSHGRIRVTLKDLESEELALPDRVIDQIADDQEYAKFFHRRVRYVENARTPTQILKAVRDFASDFGEMILDQEPDGRISIKAYRSFDPEQFLIVILDHFSLIQPETGQTLKQAIGTVSKGFVEYRNQCLASIIGVQQQAETRPFGIGGDARFVPMTKYLADDKDTQRDINWMIGLYSVYPHGVQKHAGYDNLDQYRDNLRFIRVMRSRHGGADLTKALFFDGGCRYFRDMPPPNDFAQLDNVRSIVRGISSF